MEKIIAMWILTKNSIFDDDYTMYKDGEVLNEYNRHSDPESHNLKETLLAINLDPTVKECLLAATANNDKAMAKNFG